jgi:hypothetical protein
VPVRRKPKAPEALSIKNVEPTVDQITTRVKNQIYDTFLHDTRILEQAYDETCRKASMDRNNAVAVAGEAYWKALAEADAAMTKISTGAFKDYLDATHDFRETRDRALDELRHGLSPESSLVATPEAGIDGDA